MKGKPVAPGAGEFVSDGKKWVAAKTKVTTLHRNPENLERWLDVPVPDPSSPTPNPNDPGFIPMMQLNPAAVDTIARSGNGADGITVSAEVEKRDLHKEQMDSLIEIQRSNIVAQEARDARMEKLFGALVQALTSKGGK